ncbi:zinc finger, CCHC-type containing protein [Tanacetum coccineum]
MSYTRKTVNLVPNKLGSKQVGLKQFGSKQVGFKQLGHKQVGFKQLGPGVETGVHGAHDEKHVWFEVELQGDQGDCEAEVFQVSNDDIAVAQRRLKDKQPEEKTNTDYLRSTQQYMKSGVAKHLGAAGLQQQNGLVQETNATLLAKVYCFLIQSGLSKDLWAEDTTMSTYLVNRSPSSAIGFKTPVDMLGFFGWLAIKQGMLEPVKVKCIFLGYHKGTSSVQVLKGVKFEVEPQEDHTFEVEPHGNVDHVVGNAVTTTMAITGSIHQAEIWATKGLLDKAKGNILGMEIVRDQSGNTLRVSQSRFYNEKLVQTLLEGHFILSLEGSLSGDCDVEKNGKWSCIYAVGSQEYQMACTRLDIASDDVATYMTLTKAAKEAIWLKGLAIESGFELKIIVGISTGALSKAIPGSRFQH